MKVALPYLHEYRDRQGNVRRYFRRGGKSIPLPGKPGSPEFHAAYSAATAGFQIAKPSIGEGASIPGTVRATISAYYTHNSFVSLARSTQKMRRAILERFREKHGERRISLIEQKHVASILGTMKPFAARNWMKTLRGLMQFAVAIGLRKDDPTIGIKPVNAKFGTIHTWTEDEIDLFERHHAMGTRARLAMALLLYTAARRGDIVGLGPQHVTAGRLRYRQQKTGRALAIPIHPELAAVLETAPRDHLTFLTTAHGKPFSAAGFGNWFRECCDAAGLPQCSSHGLRKAQARRLAEAGCSAHEIAAVTGHKTLSEVQRYTAAADQSRLADAAMKRTR